MTIKNEILCETCVYNFKIANSRITACGKCGPKLDNVGGIFVCEDYVQKKEVKNEKKND